jgi:apolipoprotein N-acyltransferase
MGALPPGEGRRLLVAALAGFSLHLAHPRPGWDLLGWVAVAPLIALGMTAPSARLAMIEGWVAGGAFFVLLLRWIVHTLVTYTTVGGPAAVLALALLSAYLGFYWALVLGALARSREEIGPAAVWLAPAFWVTAELGRSHLLSGIPWGLLGYLPWRRPVLIQVAAWTGVYGVSALLVTVNAALAHVSLARDWRQRLVGGGVMALAVAGVVVLGTVRLGSVETAGSSLPIALVQGNLGVRLAGAPGVSGEAFGVYGELTRLAARGARLVVWPEAAVPAYLRREPIVLRDLVDLAKAVERPLLVGALDATSGPPGNSTGGAAGPSRYVNTALLVTGDGVIGRYDKMHLVPFGEYVPLRPLLFFVEAIAAEVGDFSPGRVPTVFPLAGAPFGTVICYEIVFPDLVRRFVAEGASFMVNITNDAWFGDTGGPLQHLAAVPLRAVENGVAIGRVANTGVSALVLPTGAIAAELPLGRRGVLQAEVPLRADRTFYTRHGDVFARTMAGVSGAALLPAALAALRRRRS